jgi:CRISPR-associated protein Csb2
MRWLCIEVHFLDGRYHGRSDEGRGRQWPPNPHRLFQALIAAGHLGFRRSEFCDAKKAAFRWFECQGPPEIIAAPARSANVTRLYVPNNDMDKVARFWAANKEPEKQPNELRTDKDLRPHLLDGDATVRFLWPVADDEWESVCAHVDVICEEARHLHSLGLGVDLVAGNGRIVFDAEKNASAGDIWVADEDGIGWRAPVEGSLDELLARYARPRLRMGVGRGAERWVASPEPPTMFREVALSTPRRVAPASGSSLRPHPTPGKR